MPTTEVQYKEIAFTSAKIKQKGIHFTNEMQTIIRQLASAGQTQKAVEMRQIMNEASKLFEEANERAAIATRAVLKDSINGDNP